MIFKPGQRSRARWSCMPAHTPSAAASAETSKRTPLAVGGATATGRRRSAGALARATAMWSDGTWKQTIWRSMEKKLSHHLLFEMADEPDDDALELELVLGRDADRLHRGVRRAQLDVIALGKIFFHRRLAVDERDDGLAGRGARLPPDDDEVAGHDALLAHRFALDLEREALLVAERQGEALFLRDRLDRAHRGGDGTRRETRALLELRDGDLDYARDAPRAALVARHADARGAEFRGQFGLREF